MKKGLALIAAGSMAAVATPAFAQDSDFSGPWVAGIAGYDINKAGSTQDDDFNVDRDESVEGLTYGGAIGYDMDFGNFVLGAEAELTDSTADSDYDNDFETFGLGRVDAGRDIYVGARAGFKLAPQTMLYTKAGYTNARFNYVGTDGDTDYRTHLDADGFRLGAGVEQKFGSNAFGRLEYRYSNYSKGELDFEAENIPDSDRFDLDTDRHQIVAAVGWRF
ncbi:membrane protein [Altererythrobacter sp. B11]|uniref:outer membrane protein n=1 Tax=Altererythrobacter sp. B11 TaxID=2060312 RepID=UPI000DC6FBA9|nr:outer membrane beta-barrel protein [Altererythrobacter sp. B11]BBC72598.1 membrane protein [Altererythrobacter sp. B11]